MAQTKTRAKIAHQTRGRVRLKLTDDLDAEEADQLVQDLKVSPDVSNVTRRGAVPGQ